jgi:two-component system chemotaxis response regulator CheB
MKILVVDDSIVFRSAIVSAISTENGIEVVRSLVNGKLALDYLEQHNDIDLITLDMEMPVMDGMETIKAIRKFNQKIVIIIFSAHTQKGAEKTFEALKLGANDFVTKPDNIGSNANESINSIKIELLPKILAFKDKLKISAPKIVKDEVPLTNLDKESLFLKDRPELIVIGSSTGGPEALSAVFKNISGNVNVPMLVVQHMPPIFTEKLAEMLSKLSSVKVLEAKEGDTLKAGVCYIAPGDYHMVVDSNKVIHLNQDEKVCFVRPSVDTLLFSLAKNFRGKILSIVLTGMGEDGAQGNIALNEKKSMIYVQDKDSSVVWGMPGATKRNLPDSKVIPLSAIGMLISNNTN